MGTRRRLVYLPDDETLQLGELTDSPGPRPSRVSWLPVASSDGETGVAHLKCRAESPVGEDVDTALLVSYDGYTLANGSGVLRPPPTAQEAAALYRSLKECCRFLGTFLQPKSHSLISMDPAFSSPLSSSFSGSDCSDTFDSESDPEPSRQLRKKRKQEKNLSCGKDFSSFTVPELRELMRKRGLPTSGVKAALISRLLESESQVHEPKKNIICQENFQKCIEAETPDEGSHFSIASDTDGNVPNVWNALLNMGTKLFYRSNGSLNEGQIEEAHRKHQRNGSIS